MHCFLIPRVELVVPESTAQRKFLVRPTFVVVDSHNPVVPGRFDGIPSLIWRDPRPEVIVCCTTLCLFSALIIFFCCMTLCFFSALIIFFMLIRLGWTQVLSTCNDRAQGTSNVLIRIHLRISRLELVLKRLFEKTWVPRID